jgi:serine O-acetyltransferase
VKNTSAARQPRFLAGVLGDARVTAAHRGERYEFTSRLDALCQAARLCFVTDAFLAQVCYRLKARLTAIGIPLLPPILGRLAIVLGQVSIGDPVVIEPGVYLMHGQVVIDGFAEIGRGTTIAPFVTIGLVAGELRGPTIGRRVSVGTGAKILGPVVVGDNAKIGANAVVLCDVAPGSTVVGAPARDVRERGVVDK